MKELKGKWRDICNSYLKEFCEKHEYNYEPDLWVANDPGTVICVNDMFISMGDIRYDVDNNIDEEMFAKWYWKALDVRELTGKNYMNYSSFCEGAPDEWTEERMNSIRLLHNKIEESRKELMKLIDNKTMF